MQRQRSISIPIAVPPTPEGNHEENQALPDVKCFIDGDPAATFLVPINLLAPTPFKLLLCNRAFEDASILDEIQTSSSTAVAFRAWTQAVIHWKEQYEFAGRYWSAYTVQGRFKCVRENGNPSPVSSKSATTRNGPLKLNEDTIKKLEEERIADARLASLYRMMEMSDVGTFEYAPDGTLIRANESWYRLSGHPRKVDAHVDFSFMDLVYPRDAEMVLSQWNKLSQGIPVTFEMRWKGPDYREDGAGSDDDFEIHDRKNDVQHILSACIPIIDEGGKLISIAGNTIDINAQKQAQQRALQAKKKQENFIDMTSHEMRNPLSAVVQCADSTLDSLKSISTTIANNPDLDIETRKHLDDELRLSSDSLSTIISCSLHQRRVVDDILTLSKMDSNLMTISPVRTAPAQVVSDAVHMFELECQKDGIRITFVEDPSLKILGANWVMMDPSRALQVLINLITNAIKFTRDRPRRDIEVSLGASLERPQQNWDAITLAPVSIHPDSLLRKEDWGTGTPVYIWIKCRDTGCGLSQDEQGNLFTRFSQATPRTHIRYGGSGLGLFISKRLTELQGGAIGVRSEPNVGSTFAFFIATRLTTPPTPLAVEKDLKQLALGNIRATAPKADAGSKLGYTVLIVEDNLVNQKVLSLQLRKLGCTVHVANHGLEALEFLRTTNFWSTAGPSTQASHSASVALHIVLMDIEMPVMDGLACTRKIRELQASREIVGHVPIIAVSANARSEQMAQAREAGIDDAIAKPFRLGELVPKIEALIRPVVVGSVGA